MSKQKRHIMPTILTAAAIITAATITTPIANAAEETNTNAAEAIEITTTNNTNNTPETANQNENETNETTADETAESYHVYTVNITVDGEAYINVSGDDDQTVWEFVNKIGINDTNDTNVTLRDENGDEISRDTLIKELDGRSITTEAVDNKPQTPTEPEPPIDTNTTEPIPPTDEATDDNQNAARKTESNTTTNTNETNEEHVFFIHQPSDPNGELTPPEFPGMTDKFTFTEGETYRDALIEGTYPEQRMFERYVFKDPTTGEEFDMNQQAKDGVTIQYERLARATYILNATPDGKAEKFFIELDGMEAYDTAVRDTSDGDLQLPTLTDPNGEYVCVGIEPIMDSVENPAFLPNQTAYIEQHYPDGVPDTEGQQIAENSTIETAKTWKVWADPVENGGIYTYGNGKIGYYGEVKIWQGWKSNHPVGMFRAVWEKKPETPQETPETPETPTPEETPEETPETPQNAPQTPTEAKAETPETPQPEIVQTGNDRLTTAATAGAASVALAAAGGIIAKINRRKH